MSTHDMIRTSVRGLTYAMLGTATVGYIFGGITVLVVIWQ